MLDIETVAAIAHEAGVPLIVDNTVATPYLVNPLRWGADIVVHSATKYLGGHGTAIGGVIVDGGTFDFAQHPERFPNYNTPDPSYNGLVFARDLGVGGALRRQPGVHPQGARPAAARPGQPRSPRSTRSSSPRASRRCRCGSSGTWPTPRRSPSGSRRARTCWRVNYAGLESSPWHANQLKYAPRGAGAVLSFELEGGAEAGQAFVSALELHSNVANIGDVRSLVIHPASTTHSQLTPDEQALSGVTPGLVRLAVGLEHIDDILADLEAGFRAAKGA